MRLTPGLLAVLGFISAVGPFATDMYLSSFTRIAADLGTGPTPVQLTLTAFFAGMACGQLCNGPLSDKFGRRPVLLIAFGLFAASSIAMVFSPNIAVFIALRLVQGFSGSAGIVIARAIAADLSTGDTAVRALSLIAMVTSLGPLIAPPIGGTLAVWFDWRGVLAALALVATAMFFISLWFVPESHPEQHRHQGHWLGVFRGFGGLLRDGIFMGYVVAFAFGFAVMMSYIAASPFVAQHVLGMSGLQYALAFTAGATALILMNLLNARIAPRVGVRRMLMIGFVLHLVAGVSFVLHALTGTLTPVTFIILAFSTTAGTGLTLANASALALARTTQRTRGTGAAILGTAQFLCGALVSPIVGLWGETTSLPMALCLLGSALVSAAGAVAAMRVYARSQAASHSQAA